ncbi:metallopeptidase TldD-related protein [Acetomicrobium sp. S15 = DSM 107314]|uniref:metallopeptidase TldD-related protein n=1 Tax=Acetomicrobium sp. S15 = DSM 107314 TaxID=2529858 RepID=UPI00315830BE
MLYNIRHANEDGATSTGNASRGMASPPDVDITNLYPMPGEPVRLNLSRRRANYIPSEHGGEQWVYSTLTYPPYNPLISSSSSVFLTRRISPSNQLKIC